MPGRTTPTIGGRTVTLSHLFLPRFSFVPPAHPSFGLDPAATAIAALHHSRARAGRQVSVRILGRTPPPGPGRLGSGRPVRLGRSGDADGNGARGTVAGEQVGGQDGARGASGAAPEAKRSSRWPSWLGGVTTVVLSVVAI